MANEWIKRLAKRVTEILESDGGISRETYESRVFRDALKQAALEQRIDITDRAKWIYALDAVKESVRASMRYRNRIRAEHRPITAGIAAPEQSWLELALPPGDRD
jgi:hypothetical protein